MAERRLFWGSIDMSAYLRWVIALFLAGFPLTIAAASAADTRMLCVHDIEPPYVLDVRAAPEPGARVVGQFPAKACGVKLVGQCTTSGWCEMGLGGTVGWVNSKSIAVYDVPRAQAVSPHPAPPTVPAEIPRRRAEVIEQGSRDSGACVARVERGDTLRIRRGPGVDYSEIGEIPPGACGVAQSGGCKGRWCRVAWRGREGWVNTYYLD